MQSYAVGQPAPLVPRWAEGFSTPLLQRCGLSARMKPYATNKVLYSIFRRKAPAIVPAASLADLGGLTVHVCCVRRSLHHQDSFPSQDRRIRSEPQVNEMRLVTSTKASTPLLVQELIISPSKSTWTIKVERPHAFVGRPKGFRSLSTAGKGKQGVTRHAVAQPCLRAPDPAQTHKHNQEHQQGPAVHVSRSP